MILSQESLVHLFLSLWPFLRNSTPLTLDSTPINRHVMTASASVIRIDLNTSMIIYIPCLTTQPAHDCNLNDLIGCHTCIKP